MEVNKDVVERICECPVHRCLNVAGHYRCQLCGKRLCEDCAVGSDSDLCATCNIAVDKATTK